MGDLTMSRRSFVKTAAITGAAVAAFGTSTQSALADQTYPEVSGQDTVEVKTCCRGCGKMECGVKVIVQNGRAIRIEGDEGAWQSMGNCCTKSQSSIQAAYHPDRLHYPMKRTNPKGEEPGWVRISWDEAMETIIKNFAEITEKYGAESIACQVGTSRVWCMHSESILKNLLGTPNNIEAWQICKGPRHFATTMVSQFALSWMETIGRPRVYVQWAGASELSNYDTSCRTTVDCASRADYHISVDPRMANMGKEADYWQCLRPGTDGALALAWTNVIIENKLYDELYVKKWTNAPFLVCEDFDEEWMLENGFPTVRTDGSYWDVKTHLVKESDIKEGGSPFKFLVYDNNWEALKEQGVEHEYGAFTWFNADQEARIDNTGGFWEGENYSTTKAYEGHEAQQPNLLPGQTQGWLPDLLPFDPAIDPALEGEFEITLKDGRTVKVKPVWEHYKARAAEYNPEVASEITGIPADQIIEAATVYGTRLDPESGYGNGGIQYMLAQEHACNCVQNSRALDNLCGITGNMDTPGGMRGPTMVPIDGDLQGFSAWAPGASTPPAEIMEKQIGMERFPLLHWWQYWSDASTCWDAVLEGDPYPLKALWNESGNFMSQTNTARAWEALCNLEFMVDLNLWHAPSTDAADIILPVAHWIELNSPRASQGSEGAMGATVKCVQPPAEAKYDPEIVMDLARRMGVPWNNEEGNEWPDIEWQLADAIKLFSDEEWTYTEYEVKDGEVSFERKGTKLEDLTPKYKTWDEYVEAFQRDGWWQAKDVDPKQWGTYRRYQTGGFRARDRVWARLDYTAGNGIGDWKPGFFTPTMKQELWSTVMESHFPDKPEWFLPSWVEPPHGPKDGDRIKEYPLTATTGRRIPVYFHSEHRQLPWCRELWPVPRIEINPETAAEYGIEQGDWVWIESEWGKIREVADLYYGVDKDVVNLEHTWWYPELSQNAGHGIELSAVNNLIDHHAQDPHAGSSNLRAYQVKIYKATPENSPFNNPVPCGVDGVPIIHTSDDPRLKEWLPTYEGRE
ncbi:Dimethylsulfide dehydrogenase subunit alpha precursor [Slackia heliotrinireducens]|uniref:Anaerobic dehydrogenase, typically selenocysteine-containing n=1 Tax=Slackia heliotrinireducens (strain ATCC 29202 / DSM 20476 / NCTC 11029 / RHS 1) TaxID=471855 RepID=C7N3L0_SLAHD|nr:molybdopterin-dependent oxidoreductase [Slackia heliotrinireducens]ACV23733.1 anaerobic dehydrogenase, typically selenocysteine-containing [Slackia heliotrinireducens DSM 20476]VEH03333.1 Dimethylsulfide dehydrogenase subunit alpha precursor [Slackia heliotrinireducens]